MTFYSTSEPHTGQIGRKLAGQLLPGDVVLLRGELGAGKSVLARAVARGLGVEAAVTSPTFALMNIHHGRYPLHHFDLYRLSGVDELEAAGLAEFLGDSGAISLVEWPENAEDAMPRCHLDIRIDYADGENTRLLTVTRAGGFREVSL